MCKENVAILIVKATNTRIAVACGFFGALINQYDTIETCSIIR